MTTISEFKAANPNIKLYDVNSPEFSVYGVLYPNYDISRIKTILTSLPLPESGSRYLQSIEALEKEETIQSIGKDIFAGLPINAGATIGYTTDFSAVEFHQSSEVNIALDDVILVLGQRQLLEVNQTFDPHTEGKAFYIPAGSVIELFNTTLHYAPVEVFEHGYRVVVVVVEGTNTALPSDFHSQNPRVVKKGKFQVVHPSRKDKIAQGYQVGMSGELMTFNPLKG